MNIRESWRFAVKCMKLSYKLKTNLICMSFLAVIALVYEIFNISDGMGAYLMAVLAMYPAQLVCSLCGSCLVQSSPYKKVLMTSLPTTLTFCSGIVVYLLIIGIEGIRVCVRPQALGQSTRMILLCGVMLMLLDIYVGIAYKYFVLSIILLSVSMVGFYSLSGIIGKSVFAQYLMRIPLPAALGIGLCCLLLGGALQYGLSLLVYKKPMSRRAIFGLLRQQA